MWRWVANQYSRRIVNINVNIIVAGILAAFLSIIPVHLSRYVGVRDDDKTLIIVITGVSDWVFDLVIAVGLHWLANHWPKRMIGKREIQNLDELVDGAPPPMPFLKDATIIQLQRACLSPLLYAIAFSLQWYLLHVGVARELTGIIGFAAGIAVCRVIHTVWLIRSDRKVLEEWEAKKHERLEQLRRERNGAAITASDAAGHNGANTAHAEPDNAHAGRPGVPD